MSAFINIDTGVINKKYFLLHAIFSTLWATIIGVLIFRVDKLFVDSFLPAGSDWVTLMFPVVILLLIYFTLRGLKWYFIAAFIFYIPLLIVWFIPKFVLQKGKFYLFISYLNAVINRFIKWRSSFLHLSALIIVVILLSNIPTFPVRILGILFCSYILIKLNYKYAQSAFHPTDFFNSRVKKFFSPKSTVGEEKKRFEHLEKLVDNVPVKDLSKKEAKERQVAQLVAFHTLLDTFKHNLSSSKNRYSFLIYWVFTFLASLVLSIILVAFINFQIYLIDSTAFAISGEVGFGDFIRYTAKCLTYGDIQEIIPKSSTAKIIEGGTFLVLGLLYLIIVVSFGFSFQLAKLDEEKVVIVKALDEQLDSINEFALQKFGKKFEVIMREIDEISDSVEKIRDAFNEIL